MVDVMASLCGRRSGDIFRDPFFMLDNPALVALNRDGLHRAASEGRADELEAMLDGLGAMLQVKQKRASRASRASDTERIKRKVVDQRNSQGQTALMLACSAASVGCARLLLAARANPTLMDGQERTCLHYAAQASAADVLELLLGDGTLVETAAGEQLLLRDAFVADPQGHRHKFIDGLSTMVLSPLHLASCRGDLAAVEVLLKWGARPSVRCTVFTEEEGHWPPFSTPLHLAATNGHANVAAALLRGWARLPAASRGHDLRTLEDFRGRRPVDVARSAGHTSLYQLLDPSLPLQQAFRPPTAAVPPLAALAAGALRQRLLAQLDGLEASAPCSPGRGVSTQEWEACEAQQRGGEELGHAQQAQHGGTGEAQAGQLARAAGGGSSQPSGEVPAWAAAAEEEGSTLGGAARWMPGNTAAPLSVQVGLPGSSTPGTPMEALASSQQQPSAGVAPALQLTSVPAPAPRASALMGSCSPAACGVCLGRASVGSGQGGGSVHSGSSGHSGTAGSSQRSNATCPICFDRWGRLRLLAAADCGHRLCFVCARTLCEQTRKGRAVRCPMCRGLVGGWDIASPPEAGPGYPASAQKKKN